MDASDNHKEQTRNRRQKHKHTETWLIDIDTNVHNNTPKPDAGHTRDRGWTRQTRIDRQCDIAANFLKQPLPHAQPNKRNLDWTDDRVPRLIIIADRPIIEHDNDIAGGPIASKDLFWVPYTKRIDPYAQHDE